MPGVRRARSRRKGKSPMNPFSKMESRVKALAPSAELRRDLAKKPKGTSFLDIVQGDFTASVEFRPGHGFGLTAPQGATYGAGPDEVVADEELAIARVVELLAANGKTTAHRELSLKRLREIRRLTQQELARRLDVKQATVSKLEQREDEVLVSTLKRVVAALGGKLEIVARFADGPLALELGDIDAEPLPPQRPPSRAK